METDADFNGSILKGVAVADSEQKTLQRLLACTVLEHVWHIFKFFLIRQLNARICSCVYKQIRAGQTRVGRGFTVK
jgi:hypothetical protein